MKTAALYARVSTDKQEKEQTVQSQIDALQRAARERGYAIPAELIFVDEGYSGARMDRPALDRLRDLAAETAFHAVLIYSPDRLARQYAYQVVVMEELKRHGCEVVFVNHDFGNTPEQQMLLQMQGVFAEYERALIKERMRRGNLYAASQGRVNWGVAPYGYRYIRKSDSTPQQLVLNETEAEVVRQIYRWLVDEQMTSCAIARRLSGLSVPTRKQALRGWAQSTVAEILRKPLYKGEAFYNCRKRVDAHRPQGKEGFKDLRPGNLRGRAPRPREEWIPVRVPAIIDPGTWDLAQVQAAKNRERAMRNNKKHEYLLRGLLVCGRCGHRMIGARPGNSGLYICSVRYPKRLPGSCDGRTVNASAIEKKVWDHVRDLLADPEVLRAQYEQSQGDPAIIVQEEQERERIERKLQGLSREVERLIDAYQAGVIGLKQLTERRARVEEHGRMLRERVSEIQSHRTTHDQQLRLIEGLREFCASVRSTMDQPSFSVKQQVLRLVLDRIVIEEARVVIQHVIPTGPIRLQRGIPFTQVATITCGSAGAGP
jgi:site-specific DNA recombinase